MSTDLYLALSGAMTRLRELDVVANNLANAETTGFKRETPIFAVALEASLRDVTRERVGGVPGRVFAETRATRLDLAPGPIARTSGPLDVAIDGPGFFEVETPAGPRYTRAGSFVVDPQGRLTTPDGFPVLGTGGPIAVGDRPVEIRASGAVVDDREDEVGRLRVVRFDAPENLVKEGSGLFRAGEDLAPLPVENPELIERSLERSNVRPVEELASLVALQRSFDAAMRVLETGDRVTGQLLREVSS